MREGILGIRGSLSGASYFIDILLPISMYDDLIAILQLVQIHKRTWFTIRQIDMSGDDTVAGVGWESSAFQIASLRA